MRPVFARLATIRSQCCVAACASLLLLTGCASTPIGDPQRQFAGTPLSPYQSTAPALICRGCELR
ncbi:hypothetical protein QZM82_31805 [Burkholderia cepacia]|uniref:hypothetical protein n=1 Tax=Burkholderia cepacia TaxID=292 RepID=UPI00264DD0FF|nr:hypothetical protein [Burkholderia cepacia]MDN7900785.1 hypothetical protein [Burkholderia cepacia]